ncbi:MAG: glycosyltransferase family 2 protein, partial [Candidatus Sumerlaeia bacterium]|nr:glycosyltransferase family 2 protein [Candidatus Sumerlaeia bacterium]
MTEPLLSLIIACYNEENHLVSSVREIENLFSTLRFSYELIFVDDCSTDNTQLIIHQLVNGRENRHYIQHQYNKGRGATVTDGFYQARGEIVGFIDIDLEVHCRYIPAMVTSILV